MKFFCLFAVTAARTEGPIRKHKHSTVIDLPHKITFNGLHLDLDQFKPRASETGMDSLKAEIVKIGEKEHQQLQAEQDVIKKVENEFLESDLHKEAMTLKFRPEEVSI